ncbi:MAG TPA: tripartite tricarboxylate transporter TctB family protein [Thermoanaerobacterales bacterium]|nr:tripartite tricarboxylate transporter TctB family protein [Thermoanaerobacterales bacterium]
MAEIIAGFFALALGIVWLIVSFSLAQSSVGGSGFGPSFFPRLVSCAMIVLSLMYLVKIFRGKTQKLSIKFSKTSILMMIGAVVYLLLLNIVGYIIATFGYLLFSIYSLSKAKSLKDFFAATLIVVCLYSIFHLGLKVPLPRGLLI